jgi:hypothetical protein
MRYFRCNFRKLFYCAAFVAAPLLGACGDTCFFGFVNNGKGGAAVAAGNPPPACPPQKASGAVRVIALQLPACESCTPAARVVHIFVTIRGIALRPSALGQLDRDEWLEIAPQLESAPLQMDLAGDEQPQILVKSLGVPAGAYREIRLQLFEDAPRGAARPAQSACGQARSNCMVWADGSAEPIRWPGERPELLLAIESPDSDAVAIVPDAGIDLRLTFTAQTVFSGARGWATQRALAGSASMGRRWSLEEDPPLD